MWLIIRFRCGFQLFVQLKRPSDGAVSDALPFEYLPLDSGRRSIFGLRRGVKEKGNLDIFEQIMAIENAMHGIKSNGVSNDHKQQIGNDVIVLDSPIQDEKPIISTNNNASAAGDIGEFDSAHKAVEWIEKSEFITQTQEENNGGFLKSEGQIDEDKSLDDLLEQVAELDEIYSDHQIRRELGDHVAVELNRLENSMPRSGPCGVAMDFDEIFDDAATYTSLQRAFRNPVPIIDLFPPSPPMNFDGNDYDAVEPLTNPPAPMIDVHPGSLKRESPQLEEEKLPPLPPKRVKKAAQSPVDNVENQSYLINDNSLPVTPERRNSQKSPMRPQSQLIIMRTPDQSPLNKRLPPTPQNNTLPKQKKSPTHSGGFFSKLFSRRKSKIEINSNHNTETRNTPDISREPSINHFDIHDPNRLSTRSLKSLPSPSKKIGKPVGRSVSSVSGKRPHLTADITHIPLKGESSDSLPMRSGSGTLLSLPGNHLHDSTVTLSNNLTLNRKTVSALQLADLPIQEGNMELIAIADAQSLKNLCEGEYGVQLDPDVDLTEAEHYALYTSIAPYATQSEFDENSCYYAPVEGSEILSTSEVAKRLAASSTHHINEF